MAEDKRRKSILDEAYKVLNGLAREDIRRVVENLALRDKWKCVEMSLVGNESASQIVIAILKAQVNEINKHTTQKSKTVSLHQHGYADTYLDDLELILRSAGVNVIRVTRSPYLLDRAFAVPEIIGALIDSVDVSLTDYHIDNAVWVKDATTVCYHHGQTSDQFISLAGLSSDVEYDHIHDATNRLLDPSSRCFEYYASTLGRNLHTKELSKHSYTAGASLRSTATIVCVGMPRVDVLRKAMSNRREKVDSVVCAALTAHRFRQMYGAGAESNRIETWKRVVSTLLRRYSDYRLVFRPHPVDARSALTNALYDEFRENDRFCMSINEGYVDPYARAKFLVGETHMSTTKTFVLATGRPAIELAWDRHILGANSSMEHTFGATLFQDNDLVQRLENLDNNYSEQCRQIVQFAEREIPYGGRSVERLSEVLIEVLNGKLVSCGQEVVRTSCSRQELTEREKFVAFIRAPTRGLFGEGGCETARSVLRARGYSCSVIDWMIGELVRP